jgi:hypothetical protein
MGQKDGVKFKWEGEYFGIKIRSFLLAVGEINVLQRILRL